MTGRRVLLSIWTRLQEEQAHHCLMLSGQRMLIQMMRQTRMTGKFGQPGWMVQFSRRTILWFTVHFKKALMDHYKAPAHQNLLAAEADAILEMLHWKNEFLYPFDTYLTNFTKVFKSKQDANEEVPETVKVKEMLKRMKTDNPAVLASMALVRLKHPDNFKSAGEEVATQIAQIFPRSKHEREKSGYTRNRKVAAMERDGKRVRFENDGQGSHGGRGGRGGRGNNRNKNYLNGVNVSDPSRSFSPEES